MKINSYFLTSLFAVWLILLLLNNGSISLWDEDEAAYALFGQRMAETGDWVNPDFVWADIHRKTPFHFWTVALSFLFLGVNEWALRLPSVLAIFATGLYLYRWTKRNFNPETAFYSWLIFATGLFANSLGKVALTDAGLLLVSMLAVGSLWDFLQTEKYKFAALFWASIAAGLLIKGPPIVILTGGICVCCLLFFQNRKVLWCWYNFLFAGLSLLPFGAWAYASYGQDGGAFLRFLYDWYVLKRVGGSVLGQSGWVGYHLAVLSVSLLPFLPFIWGGLVNLKKTYFENKKINLYFSFCLLFAWIFYELMSSKLPAYSIAAQPILAILGGIYLQKLNQGDKLNPNKPLGLNWGAKLGFFVFFCLWVALIAALFGADAIPFLLLKTVVLELKIVAGVLSCFLIAVAYYLYQKNISKLTFAMAGLGLALQFLAWGWIIPALEQTPFKSLDKIGREAVKIQQQISQNANYQPFIYLIGISVKQTKPSLLFYLQQHFNLKNGLIFVETRAEDWEKLAHASPAVAIIGTEAHNYFKDRSQLYPDMQRFEWWSSDDELRPHDFYLLYKK